MPRPSSAITAEPGSLRRRVQLLVDHHVSHDRLIYGSLALEDAIVDLVADPEGILSRAKAETTLNLLRAHHLSE